MKLTKLISAGLLTATFAFSAFAWGPPPPPPHHHGNDGLYQAAAIVDIVANSCVAVNAISNTVAPRTQTVVVQQQPAVVQQPVVVQQPAVVQQPVVVQQPAPVVVQPAPVVVAPRW